MEKELKYWTESAAEWSERAAHFRKVAEFYRDRCAVRYAEPIEEALENAEWAADRAQNARDQLAKLQEA